MNIRQKLLIISLVIVIPCVTIIGVYVSKYVSMRNVIPIVNNEIQKQEIKNITMLYENEDGTYVEPTESTWLTNDYVFNKTLSRCENGGELSWDATTNQVVMASNASDKCYVYFDIKLTFAENIQSNYVGNDANQTLLYHDESLTNGANDKSYRYSGASDIVNNFVCFGTDESPCPVDNLYRIIGIFDDDKNGVYNVKLIKYDYATNTQLGINGDYSTSTFSASSYSTYKGIQTTINRYYWNYTSNTTINNGYGSNIWSTSLLNITNLNTNYISYLNSQGNEWSSKIADTTWQVGGNTWANIAGVTPPIAYQNEITNPATNTTYISKIGLIYVSDYGFAASQDSWTLPLYVSSGEDYRIVTQNNWMYMGLYEWTIAPYSSNGYIVFSLDGSGNLSNGAVARNGYAVRPVLYLESSVYVMDGDGSMSDPYIIAKD